MGDTVSIFINLRNTFIIVFVSRKGLMVLDNMLPDNSEQSIKFFQNGLSLNFVKAVINFTTKNFITGKFLKISYSDLLLFNKRKPIVTTNQN